MLIGIGISFEQDSDPALKFDGIRIRPLILKGIRIHFSKFNLIELQKIHQRVGACMKLERNTICLYYLLNFTIYDSNVSTEVVKNDI